MIEQNQSGKTLRFIVALACVALASSLITYWSTDTYETENALLKQQIADLQKQIEELKNPPAPEQPPVSAEITLAVPAAEVKFNSCGSMADYKTQNWYAALIQTAAANQISIDKIKNACYSENGKILVMLEPGAYCTNGAIYNYNIASNTITKASVNDKKRGCLGWPTSFGKREGTVIKMEGSTSESGCETKMYFDYDFIKNVIELKKEGNRCMNPDKKWSEYKWINY